MDRKISQKIFNDLVIENVEEFDMQEDEAVDFAVTQFEAQGVDLSNVIADVDVIKGTDAISMFSVKYMNLKPSDKFDVESCLKIMDAATTLSNKSIKYKLHAGRMDLHKRILAVIDQKPDDPFFVQSCLNHLEKTIKGYPDLMDKGAMSQLIQLSKLHPTDRNITLLVHAILLNSVQQHEGNKEVLFNGDIAMPIIKACIKQEQDDEMLLGCGLITNLCRDDDIRVQVSRSYIRATTLAAEFLIDCYSKLKLWQSAALTQHLLNAVAAMAVNNDLVMDLFKLDPEFEIVKEILTSFALEEDIIKSACKLLIALSGNDDCKNQMTELIPFIVRTIDTNMSKPKVVQSSFLLVASISLRSKNNAVAFVNLNTIEIIVQALKSYNIQKIRKFGCMAMRNMASSCKMPQPFEEAGVVELMNDFLESEHELSEECKSVLVALGAPVILTERWTGVKGDVVGGNQ